MAMTTLRGSKTAKKLAVSLKPAQRMGGKRVMVKPPPTPNTIPTGTAGRVTPSRTRTACTHQVRPAACHALALKGNKVPQKIATV